MPRSPSLSIDLPTRESDANASFRHPLSARSPSSSNPTSPSYDDEINAENIIDEYDVSSPITAFPQPPQSPASPQQRKDMPFFNNIKATKSTARLETDSSSRYGPKGSEPSSHFKSVQGSSADSGSDLHPESALNTEHAGTSAYRDQRHPGHPIKSSSVPHITPESSSNPKKSGNKHRFQLLGRSRSLREEEERLKAEKADKDRTRSDRPERERAKLEKSEKEKCKPKPSAPAHDREHDRHRDKNVAEPSGMRTAPMERDRSFKEMMNSRNTVRNRSADSHLTRPRGADTEEDSLTSGKSKMAAFPLSSSYGGPGGNFFTNMRSQGTKAAALLRGAGKDMAGKLTRSGSGHEKDIRVDEPYEFRVINQPLVEQTRITRISKRLEHSKDKTEFWMPALPWRCIDYLNMEGAETEGLYRVPGSSREVKHFQIRFDKELDINLFDAPELNDINTISSLFKAWLRQLPDEIFPKATQAAIAAECAGARSTPQMLKDELSNLPPFNYYLLFAITCHISLLHSCADQNKMTYSNLCICFQPCLKIDAFCFQFLVLDWRNCWQGCRTEKEYLAREMEVINALENPGIPPPLSSSRNMAIPSPVLDERTISSSGSSISKPSLNGGSTPERQRPQPQPLDTERRDPLNEETTPTQQDNGRLRNDLPALSPVKPLSPIGPI